jgi:hypothetical protein
VADELDASQGWPLAVLVAPGAQPAPDDLFILDPAVAEVSWLELDALLALGSGVVDDGAALGEGMLLGAVALGGVGMVGVAALAGPLGAALGAAPGAGVCAMAAPARRRPAPTAPARK